MTRRLLFAVAALCLIGVAGCGRGQKAALPAAGSGDAEKYLFDHGSESLAKKHWLQSREYFKKLVDTYPQSQYRQEAKLGIGDSYLGENSIESNILAVNEFREFLSFFPGNERTDYAQYKIAVGYSNQMLGAERDPTPAQDALTACDTFLKNYPSSKLKPPVEAVRRRARDQLSGKDLKVGMQYYRINWFPGAVARFKGLLAADAEFGQRDAVYFYLGEIYHRSKQDAVAVPYYDQLVKEFEKSEYLERAKRRVAEIQNPAAPKATPTPAKTVVKH